MTVSYFIYRAQLHLPFVKQQNYRLVQIKRTDDKSNVAKIMISVGERVENIVRKGEMLITSNFSFSHNVFKSFQSHQKSGLVDKWLNID